MKKTFLTLALSGLALLIALDAGGHIGISKRVGNLNLTLSVMGLNEMQGDEGEISSLVPGAYGFQLYLLDIERNYQPVDGAVVQMELSHEGQAQATLDFVSKGQGEYFVEGHFDHAGHWTGTLSIAQEGQPLASAEVDWDVLPAPSQEAVVTWADWIWIAVAGILAAGALVWWQLGRKPSASKR